MTAKLPNSTNMTYIYTSDYNNESPIQKSGCKIPMFYLDLNKR